MFVNQALDGLAVVLPQAARADLQRAILGASGNFFGTLPPDQRAAALGVIVGAIQRTYILVFVAGTIGLLAAVPMNVSRGPATVAI